MEPWTVKRAMERNVEEKGEVDLHSADAVKKINELESTGTPVDMSVVTQMDLIQTEPQQQQAKQEVAPPPDGVPRILIVIPILECSHKFLTSFLKFWTECMTEFNHTGELEIGYHFLYRKPVHMAETMGVNVAKHNKCTHILFMDDDIYDITPDMLRKLLVADKDVVSGVMYASGFPYAMCTFRRYDTQTTVCSQPAQTGMYRLYEIPCWCPHCLANNVKTPLPTWTTTFCHVCRKDIKDLAIQKVDLIPFPFTLMKLSVFDKISKPWFHCNTVFPTDSWFADRCIEAGIQQYAHMDVRLNHRGVTDVTRPYKYQEGLALSQGKGHVVEITPEDMQKHEFILAHKMELAEKEAKLSDGPTFINIAPEGNKKVEGVQNDKEKKS